jgi:glycosyltransferase involved in cell wall biosynthesis
VVSEKITVHVLHVVKDNNLSSFDSEEFTSIDQCLHETIKYYYSLKVLGFLSKIFSYFIYCFYLFTMLRSTIKRKGKPLSIHVHVAGRNTLIALLLSFWYGTPLYYTEHASRFLSDSKNSIHKSFFKKLQWLFFVNRCKAVSTVSKHLAFNFGLLGFSGPVSIIPNVVDSRLFHPDKKTNLKSDAPFRFLHVSNMGYEKNLKDTLKALSMLASSGISFTLELYGPIHNFPFNELESNPILKSKLNFHGEVSHTDIAEAMRNTDLLIAFSRLETFGCVVAEAVVSGLWVLISDYPSLKELVKGVRNANIVENGNVEALFLALQRFCSNYENETSHLLDKEFQKRVSATTIADKFLEFYGVKISAC